MQLHTIPGQMASGNTSHHVFGVDRTHKKKIRGKMANAHGKQWNSCVGTFTCLLSPKVLS